jgi:hypothetical protein
LGSVIGALYSAFAITQLMPEPTQWLAAPKHSP